MDLPRRFRLDLAAVFPLIVRSCSVFWVVLLAGGCIAVKPAAQSGSAPIGKSSPEATPSTKPDAMDADAASPADLVAHRVQSYSQEMAPAIANRSTVLSTSSQPSLVQWGDPSAAQLSLLPAYLLRPNSPPPPAANVDASASAANQSAENQSAGQLASMKSEPVASSSAVASAEPSNHSGNSDPAKSQIASLGAPRGPTEMMQESSPEPQANTTEPPSENAGETMSALDGKFAKRVRDYPHDVSAQFDYQLLQFQMDEPVPNMSTISSLPDEDREMLLAVMDGLLNYRNNLRADNNMLMSRKVRPLLEMADRLRALADLTIPTLALCQDVRGFGNYVPFEGDPPHFSAGMEHAVILYCEVQNFSSHLSDAKLWQTELVQDAVLYTEGGMSVWNDKTRTVSDAARNRRQDFFIVQKIRLPATLPMGRYLLKVTIEDKQSHHVAEATQPLLIVAQ